MEETGGYLIGAPLHLARKALDDHVNAGMGARFPDLRAAHIRIFGLLPVSGCRPTELAEKAGITKQSVGYLINYLIEHGYLETARDPDDRRAVLVRRTAKGLEVNREAYRLVRELQADWAGLIGEERMRHLHETLVMLTNAIGHPYAGSIAELSSGRDKRSRGRW